MFKKPESHSKNKDHIKWVSVTTLAMMYFWQQDITPQFAVAERLVKRGNFGLKPSQIASTLLEQSETLATKSPEEFLEMIAVAQKYSIMGRVHLMGWCLKMTIVGDIFDNLDVMQITEHMSHILGISEQGMEAAYQYALAIRD